MGTLEDLLSGSGKTAKFERVGDSIVGTVVGADVRQMRNYDDPNKLEFWPDGNPKNQIVITLATDERDGSDDSDDGQRNVYLKAYGSHLTELRRACKEAGVGSLQKGGKLVVTFSNEIPDPKGRNKPFKEYSLTFTSPLAATIAADDTTPPATGAVNDGDQAAYAKLLAQGVPAKDITPALLKAIQAASA